MGKVTVVGGKVGMNKPVSGILLSTLAEGSLVKINEGGRAVEYYVAKHNYESTLNGTGRTLLARKYCCAGRAYDTGEYTNEYSTCDLSIWLNGEFLESLVQEVQNVIGSTSFYYTKSGTSTIATLSRPVFLLSVTECNGLDVGWAEYNTEGSVLPIADILKIAYIEGISDAQAQWTRTPVLNNPVNEMQLNYNGSALSLTTLDSLYPFRPCFTLPATTLFDEETMTIKGVA